MNVFRSWRGPMKCGTSKYVENPGIWMWHIIIFRDTGVSVFLLIYTKLGKCLTPNKCHRIPLYLYFGTHFWNTVLWRSFCWGLCPRSPLGNMLSKDYVPDPVGVYVLRGRCPRSMAGHLSSDNYVHVSTEACTFSVAIMTCSVVRLTHRVSQNRKETIKYDHIFCFVYLVPEDFARVASRVTQTDRHAETRKRVDIYKSASVACERALLVHDRLFVTQTGRDTKKGWHL